MNSHEVSSNSRGNSRGRTLAIGFGITVAMWVVAYASMMKPGLVVGEVLFALTLACLIAGGFVAGRSLRPGESAWQTGLKIGATSASLNLLLIGSLLRGDTARDKMIQAVMWAIGAYVVSMALAVIGAMIGAARRRATLGGRNWHQAFTCVAAATVLLLLITGGLVTGLKAGMAVPDWPNSFGHNMLLYPLSQMIGGVYYEHAHRLYGMLVGVTAITVAITMFFFDERRWLRSLAVIYLLMVCMQGVLGGTRVTEVSRTLAIIHGVFGQLVFATIVCIAAFTSTTWKHGPAASTNPRAKTDRLFTLVLLIMLLIQLGLGAMYRHLQRDMANPPEPFHLLLTHIVMAGLVALVLIFAAGRAWGLHRDQAVLPALGRLMLGLVCGQIVLGVSAMIAVWWSDPLKPAPAIELVVTTAHQATGAMLLASAAMLMLWTRRLLAVARAGHPQMAQMTQIEFNAETRTTQKKHFLSAQSATSVDDPAAPGMKPP